MEKEIDFQEEEEEMNDVDNDLECRLIRLDGKGKENEWESDLCDSSSGLVMIPKKNPLKKVKQIDVW